MVVFSHGLGGLRNTYSHICGSLASHGAVIVALEHRDGSAPISFVRDMNGVPVKTVEYRQISHEQTQEVQNARGEQLKIRLWEIGILHDLLTKIDAGISVNNFSIAADKVETNSANQLSMFRNTLNVHDPGSITWAGHSFGAATIVQFIKSVFYRPSSSTRTTHELLYCPAEQSAIVKQITPQSAMALLDIWMLPVLNPHMRWLREKALPTYLRENAVNSNVLAILSEGFFKWQANFIKTREILSPDPQSRLSASHARPHIFYAATSAHLSQSDFGILFPILTRIALKAQEPERTLRLNVRAILQVMRDNNIEVANTSDLDMDIIRQPSGEHVNEVPKGSTSTLSQDKNILLTNRLVRGWIPIDLDDQWRSHEASNMKMNVSAVPTDVFKEEEAKP